jgi:DNA-binding NarL/FixJ family response regulator
LGLLTEFERKILELSTHGSSDYKIAKKLSVDPPTVSRSRKNALRKLQEAEEDIAWVRSLGLLNFNIVARRTIIEAPELRPAF